MNDLRVAQIGCADGVLDGSLGEALLEEAVHMPAEDGFQEFLFLEPGDEIQGGPVRALLDLAIAPLLPFRIRDAGLVGLRQFRRNPAQIGALASHPLHLVLVEFRRVQRNVAKHHHRQAFGHLRLHLFQLPFREVVIHVVHRHEIHAVDDPVRKAQVVGKGRPDGLIAVLLVGFVFLRLAHVLGVLMVSGAHEPVALDHMPGRAVQIGLRHEVVQIPRVEQVHAPLASDPDGFVQIVLAGVHAPGTVRRQADFPLVVPAVRPSDVRIGHVHRIEGLLQAYVKGYFLDVQRGINLDVPSDPLRIPGPFPDQRPVFGPLRNSGPAAAKRHSRRGRPGYFDEISSVHLFQSFKFLIVPPPFPSVPGLSNRSSDRVPAERNGPRTGPHRPRTRGLPASGQRPRAKTGRQSGPRQLIRRGWIRGPADRRTGGRPRLHRAGCWSKYDAPPPGASHPRSGGCASCCTR